MRCPSFERLIDYLDNRIAEPDRVGVAAHLATGCSSCAENRDWYDRTRLTAASDDSVAPPFWVLKRAVRIFETNKRPAIGERIRQAIASLVFDSFARPSLAGVRSSETTNRQLLYRAGDYNIDLQIASSDEAGAELIGQILKEGEPGFESVSALNIEVVRDKEPVRSTVTGGLPGFKWTLAGAPLCPAK